MTYVKQNNKNHQFLFMKFFDYLFKNGPLKTIECVSGYMQRHFYLDSNFDKRYGTDTSGVISIKDLTIVSKNTELANWYAPAPEKIFHQIMKDIPISFGEFVFIDFGSGKGRVLLMASEYGFKKIIGVEFAKELHNIATTNVGIYKSSTKKSTDIETICQDATIFPIPNEKLVIFFYSPFKGKVLEQVLTNISLSFAMNHKKIILVFYGENPESLKLFKALNFQSIEHELRKELFRLKNYRRILFISPD